MEVKFIHLMAGKYWSDVSVKPRRHMDDPVPAHCHNANPGSIRWETRGRDF